MEFTPVHLRNVEIFCDVVTRRSFSKAAEANSVSQSSASQAVHMLEKRVGTCLIDRSIRPFELTEAGKVYFDGCRRLLDAFREIEDSVQRLENRVRGRIRVASIYSVGLLQMDCYVKQFQELYPDVDVRIEYLHPDEVYKYVLSDDADIGLVSFPRDGGEIGSIPWQVQPMHVAVNPQHELASRNAISPEDLNGMPFVGFNSGLTIRSKMDRWLKEQHVTVDVVHQFDNIENIKRAVEIGSGVAILPVPTMKRESLLGSLVAIPFADVEWYRPLGIIHKRHKTLPNAVSKFVELLHEDPSTFIRTTASEADDNQIEANAVLNRRTETDRRRVAP